MLVGIIIIDTTQVCHESISKSKDIKSDIICRVRREQLSLVIEGPWHSSMSYTCDKGYILLYYQYTYEYDDGGVKGVAES